MCGDLEEPYGRGTRCVSNMRDRAGLGAVQSVKALLERLSLTHCFLLSHISTHLAPRPRLFRILEEPQSSVVFGTGQYLDAFVMFDTIIDVVEIRQA
jgi:hypothetical protein